MFFCTRSDPVRPAGRVAEPWLWWGTATIHKGGYYERERRWNWEAEKRNDPHLRSSRAVTGYHIQATDGDIGHVADFLVDDYSWAIRYMIADTSNWWLGKKVLVAPAWIKRVDWDNSKLHVTVTRMQIKNSPEYDPTRPVECAYETQLYGHYGQPRYWDE